MAKSRALARLMEDNTKLKGRARGLREDVKAAPASAIAKSGIAGKVTALGLGTLKGSMDDESVAPMVVSIVLGGLGTIAGGAMLSSNVSGGAMVAGAGSTALDICAYEAGKYGAKYAKDRRANKGE